MPQRTHYLIDPCRRNYSPNRSEFGLLPYAWVKLAMHG